MQCNIAMRNLCTGALMGCLPVPEWDPGNDADLDRDLVLEAFVAAYPDHEIRPHQRASDNTCGTFTMGPLMGLWEWLDFGEEPVERDAAWASAIYRAVVSDQ